MTAPGEQRGGVPGRSTGVAGPLDTDAIRLGLGWVQQNFVSINAGLDAELADLCDDVLENMVAGYRLVGLLAAGGVDLFSLGHSKRILELNNTVLYGPEGSAERAAFTEQLRASESHFYDVAEGGVGDLVEFHARSRFRDAWHEAAAVYVRMLASPQLFVEGNHRTGALLVSYILLRAGHPPFVLSPENAAAFFAPSAQIGRIRRRSLTMLFRRHRLERYFSRLFERAADPVWLARSSVATSGPCLGGEEMTPLEEVEALYGRLLAHYGEGEDREVRAAAKLLLVALDRMRRHGGPNWRLLVNEYLDVAAHDPAKFDLMLSNNRTADGSPNPFT